MASILVVCTGNVCRSPIAEAFVRSALKARCGARAPSVASAGTSGWEGSAAEPGSVAAAEERGLDLSAHRARRLRDEDLTGATLVLAMAAEHRDVVSSRDAHVAARTFTLKELVRLLEALQAPERDRELGGSEPETLLRHRVARADALRRSGFRGNADDEDVVDPLGMPAATYRAVATELEEWCGRLADALFGLAPAHTVAGAEAD